MSLDRNSNLSVVIVLLWLSSLSEHKKKNIEQMQANNSHKNIDLKSKLGEIDRLTQGLLIEYSYLPFDHMYRYTNTFPKRFHFVTMNIFVQKTIAKKLIQIRITKWGANIIHHIIHSSEWAINKHTQTISIELNFTPKTKNRSKEFVCFFFSFANDFI